MFHIVSRLANRRSEAPAPAGRIDRPCSPETLSRDAPGGSAVARSAGRFRGHTFQPETRCQSVRTTLAAGVYVWRSTPLRPERRRLSLDATRTGGEVNQTRTTPCSQEGGAAAGGLRLRDRIGPCGGGLILADQFLHPTPVSVPSLPLSLSLSTPDSRADRRQFNHCGRNSITNPSKAMAVPLISFSQRPWRSCIFRWPRVTTTSITIAASSSM